MFTISDIVNIIHKNDICIMVIKKTKRVLTQNDIAKIIGVSPMTVSRTINKEKYVKDVTRKRIYDAIKKFSYEPNYFARSLKIKKNRTRTIGVTLGDIENPFYSRVFKGVMDVCEKNDLTAIVCNTYYDKDLSSKNIQMLIDRGIEGVLITSEVVKAKTIILLQKKNIPFVLIGDRVDKPDINYVVIDNYKGFKKVLDYLLELGHKKIFYLRSPNIFSANERLRAYSYFLKDNNISLENNISESLYNIDESSKYVNKNINNIKKFTAIVCGNDIVAIGAMKALKENNIKIPNDISITGFDNIKMTDLLYVPLTTISQPKYLLGKKSMELLVEILKNKGSKKSKKIVLDTEIIIRESCRRLT